MITECPNCKTGLSTTDGKGRCECTDVDDKITNLEAEIERLNRECNAWAKRASDVSTWKARAEKAEAERDEAVKLSRCECGTDDLCQNLVRWADRAEKAEALLEDCKAGYRTALATTEAADTLNKEMAEMLREIRSDSEQDSCPKRGEDFPLYSDNCLPPYLPEPEGE